MSLSRRALLAALPAGVAVASCGLPGRRARVDVRDHGAIGDGGADDSAAILAATAALGSGQTLYFPTGSYRFAQPRPAGRAAIAISGISDVAVEFGPAAELLMDNLHDGAGTSHGILISGPVTGIVLRNVHVRWKTRPGRRSLGDGIRIVGLPDGAARPPGAGTAGLGPVSGVRMRNCAVGSSPQAGVIMMGVSDIRVEGLTVRDSLADGLHFNACRRGTVHDHSAINTGDDGLALVTYYSAEPGYNAVAQTFSFPELNDWSCSDFTISKVTVSGGEANGVRLAGADRVRLRRLTVTGKRAGAGVIADSAAPDSDARWKYVASRGIRLEQLRIGDCEIGIHLLARPGELGDRQFTDFDVAVVDADITDCSNWGLRAESLGAHPATGVRLGACEVRAASRVGGNGGAGLQNIRGPVVKELAISHPEPLTLFSAIDCAELAVQRLQTRIGMPATADSAGAPSVGLQDCTGRIGALEVAWPGAPPSWQPVRITDAGCPGAGPPGVEVGTLSVHPPSIAEPVQRC